MAKRLWTFINESTDQEVMVEAEGFEEACNLMFGPPDALDYNDYSLLEVEDLD